MYWYNGYLVSSEIARGLDIFELTPSAHISQNEIDAANTVRFEYFNAQEQPKLVWPPSFALARSYLDQLERSSGLDTNRLMSVRRALAEAEGLSGQQRSNTLTELVSDLRGSVRGSTDPRKVRMFLGAVIDLGATR